ncbi:hypothetical protein AAG906_030911 [Vitis piasezkii]
MHSAITSFHFRLGAERSFVGGTVKISEGYFFGPHHLIMAALLYFEEKVHRKKLLRADAIPLLFPRLLCQILEHLGYPTEPQLEQHPDQPEEPVEIPADTPPPAPAVASTEHILEDTPSTPQATPQMPPVILLTSEPSPLAEPRIAISIIEYRGLCHTFQALATSRASSLSDHALGAHRAPPFVDQPMPPEEPITGETEAAEPSSPHHPPATI